MFEIYITIAIALLFAGALYGWEHCWFVPHDPEWQKNHRVPIDTGFSQSYSLVGVYTCRRCKEWMYGCAKHEQASRELRGEPADGSGVVGS